MPAVSVAQAFELALQHHQAERLAEADALYRQILAVQPNHADALHLLGVVAHQFGRHAVAVDLIKKAIAVAGGVAAFYTNLGEVYRALGQLDEAIAAHRQAAVLQPNLPDTYYNLGIALYEKGELDDAIAAHRQAIALNPNFAVAQYNLGITLQAKGQLDEAIAAYRQAIALKPEYAEAHNNLGSALREKGQLDAAIAAYGQAIGLQPDLPEAHSNLGDALNDKGQADAAIAACRRAIALKPDHASAYNNLGVALHSKGQPDEAIAAYFQAITHQPGYPKAYSNLGNALREKGLLDEAIAAYRQALALKPNYSEAHSNLGNTLRETGQLDEAIAACRQALALKPNYPQAYNNLGNALQDKGQLDEAIAAYQQAIALKANYPEAHVNLAFVLLVRGYFLPGWEEYEWRWKFKEAASLQRNFTPPQWDGGPLGGRTLLLHAEQGFGDAIQFIRYLPRVAQGGGNIILECQPELERLFQRMAPDLLVLARGQTLPAFDVHGPLLSLPRVFATDLNTIPQSVPYLHAEAAEAAIWHEHLTGLGPSLKVGLVWAGSPTHTNDRNRSLKLASLAPLGEVPGVRFLSLQKGGAAAEARTPPAGMELIDSVEKLKDFADTAALIANLDLVIAVDTAVAHLAGAMGKPVWTLLPFAHDWRWLVGRSDSPWYPTMRIFRQPSPRDWEPVIAEVREHLQLLVHSRRTKP